MTQYERAIQAAFREVADALARGERGGPDGGAEIPGRAPAETYRLAK